MVLMMPRVITTENPGIEVRRYLRHWSNPSHLQDVLQQRHTGLTPEQRRSKARDVSATVAQGIELLESAGGASLLTKPLPLFYAAEAFAKSVCMVLNPSLVGSDFRAHGLRGVKKTRYFIRTLSCETASPGADVWSRLCSLANTDFIQISLILDGVGQTTERRDIHQAPPPPPGSELVLGQLLRHLPELTYDVQVARWGHPYVVHVASLDYRLASGPPPTSEVRLTLRHAHNPETRAMVIAHETGRGVLRTYARTVDQLDVLQYHATSNDPAGIDAPPMRLDIFGELYQDFDRSKSGLGELPLYFAALFILSDVVRYQGQWKRLLDDHPDEAVLIDRFLDIAERKLPNIALNELAQSLHLFKVGR